MKIKINLEIDKCCDCPHFIMDYGYYGNHKCKKISRNLFWNCMDGIDKRCPFIMKGEE